MKKAIGLDLGMKTLGIAISDSLGISHGIELVRFKYNDFDTPLKRVLELLKEHQIDEIALGLPLHLSGEQSDMSKRCLDFKEMLLNNNPNVKVEMIDERFTSVAAHRSLTMMNIDSRKQKNIVDILAAQEILDIYIRKREAK